MKHSLVAVSAMLLLSGCAASYVATPYVAGAQRIERLAIADDSVPQNLSAAEIASVGSNFGLIGALIDAGVRDSRQDALRDALATISFDAEATLERNLVDALAQDGVQAAVLEGPQRQRRVFLTEYSNGPEGVQAYLDIVLVNYGYVSAGSGQPWRPTAYAMVRLVSAADRRVLLENHISYNTMNAPRGVITLTPNPEFVFQNREEMVTDPERLANGLRDAMQQIAATAAGLMR